MVLTLDFIIIQFIIKMSCPTVFVNSANFLLAIHTLLEETYGYLEEII